MLKREEDVKMKSFVRGRMPVMSSDDFSIHRETCEEFDDGMPLTSFPDEVESIDDLDCDCWSEFDSLGEAN